MRYQSPSESRFCGLRYPRPFRLRAAERALAREIFQQLIEIPTTQADKATPKAAQAMADRLIAAGFPREDVHVFTPEPGVGTLVARLRGTDRNARPILMLAHLDVVPALREDWSVDPWTLLERDGWFYGRGTTDNKAGAAMLVANFVRLKREGLAGPPRHDPRVHRRRGDDAEQHPVAAEGASARSSMRSSRSTPTPAASS